MKTARLNFYSAIITILLAIIFASVLAIVFGSCAKSTRPLIDDNDPIGPYHVRDPLTVFDQNVDVIRPVCDHFFVSRCVPIVEWDEDFQSAYDQSPKDCICIHCKTTETCY